MTPSMIWRLPAPPKGDRIETMPSWSCPWESPPPESPARRPSAAPIQRKRTLCRPDRARVDLLARLPPPVSLSPQCSHRRRRDPSRSDTRTEWPRRRPARAATREPKQAVWKTTYSTLLSDDLLTGPSSLEHEKARVGAIHYY